MAWVLSKLMIIIPLYVTSRSLTIVESIPENLTYSRGASTHGSTYQAWLTLLAAATQSVDIASYYWTLRGSGNNTDVTDNEVFTQHNVHGDKL